MLEYQQDLITLLTVACYVENIRHGLKFLAIIRPLFNSQGKLRIYV